MESSIQRVSAGDGTTMVTVCGEIDFSNAEELATILREAATDDATTTLRVELREATFIDSTGLGALIEGFRAATEAGAGYLVTNPAPNFRRVLTVTGLTDFFGLTDVADDEAPSAQATGT